MNYSISTTQLTALAKTLKGSLHFDSLYKSIYATDASVYRKIPLAVAFPKDTDDLKKLIHFASENKITLILRSAGTSLAGQCVGDGIVVDVSRHFTKIIHLDIKNKTVTVQPGIIRDELNHYLKPYGLFFGPNTSTSNRCMISGMVGNNSSGTTSIKYGVTRDKVIAMDTILSDGSEVTFSGLSPDNFRKKCNGNQLENKIYRTFANVLSKKEVVKEITDNFPKPSIHRRNTGYAVDALLETSAFGKSGQLFNMAKLLCGSEGTLAITTAITLQLDDLPPQEKIVVAVHFNSIQESLEATVIAMKHNLYTCELMDKTILDCTKSNREQLKNRFFIEGDPKAVLLLELKSDSLEETHKLSDNLIADLKNHNMGYAYPKLINEESDKAIKLRKAGLGLLGNIVGDPKAVACIEDTAVDLNDLPAYIADFTAMMKNFGQDAVYYAHAGAGELHLRPILNLKKSADVKLFKDITTQTAALVKKYKGSFSGEHGDGIVRGAYVKFMVGEKNYELFKKIKYTFDPQNIFNKGKIVDAYEMDKDLRYVPDNPLPQIDTLMDFSDSQGFLRAVEKCNGSGDCRKLSNAGGTMCPSYRATLDEKDTTRARANALREFLTNSDKINKFDHKELKKVFDLCLSCKACASECPSNVDIASFKAEFLHQYQKIHKPSFRTKLFANNAKYNQLGSLFPGLTNWVLNKNFIKSTIGIAKERSMPALQHQTLKKWLKKHPELLNPKTATIGEVYLFCDEFTNYYDVSIGRDAVYVLTKLGYKINIVPHEESGRSQLSKGFLDAAKKLADKNIEIFKGLVSGKTPLIGLEPSAILSFRDEYLRLANDKTAAAKVAKNTFTIEEFLATEIKKGKITPEQFTTEHNTIKIHGHCHQKSLSNTADTFAILNLPINHKVSIINSGCCGMAGSFGFEKEHYKVSMKVGEQSLFSKIRNYDKDTIIVASGTSCRHQIFDGTGWEAVHVTHVLKNALL